MRSIGPLPRTLVSCLLLGSVLGKEQSIAYVDAEDANGNAILLADDRQPALYTGNFGDCLGGGSKIQLTQFRAAYYKDNSTILFQFAGNNTLHNATVMLSIDVFAYGERRFHNLFDPCNANIKSLCAANSNTSIFAEYIIPVGKKDVASIPDIALSIVDFEGSAILRMYSNDTKAEIGCYAASMTNGNSLSQPATVGTTLGLFTIVAVIASFATTLYGDSIAEMRTHYAHSLSVGVVFAVFQHIFLSGALSMNWPSVLPAFWSNFAWSAGMIYTQSMQTSIDSFVGAKTGNISQIGGAGSGTSQNDIGGGYRMDEIYWKRSIEELADNVESSGLVLQRGLARVLRRSASAAMSSIGANSTAANATATNTTSGASSTIGLPEVWSGTAVPVGFAMPGNYSGFPGTLGLVSIRASNAFLTAFLWLVILLVLVGGALVALKWTFEALIHARLVYRERLLFFRNNWVHYTLITLVRTCFIAFPLVIFFATWDFSFQQSAGSKAISTITFLGFLVATSLSVAYAYWTRLQFTKQYSATASSSFSQIEKGTGDGRLDRADESLQSLLSRRPGDTKRRNKVVTMFINISALGRHPDSIHNNDEYTRRFGWLVSRLRKSRWWFFGAFTLYEFIRACIIGGGSRTPLAQALILLFVEIIAFGLLLWVKPFEGRRLNILVTQCLGVSKIACTALSLAFYGSFHLPRILATVIGIIMVIIQSFLTLATLVAIVAGAVTSWMSIRRHLAVEDFKPVRWRPRREKYFAHLQRAARELPPLPKQKPQAPPSPAKPTEPYFNVATVRRLHKIEDDDSEFIGLKLDPTASVLSFGSRDISPLGGPLHPSGLMLDNSTLRAQRTISTTSSIIRSNLPFGAKSVRPSWSVQDLREDRSIRLVDMNAHVPEEPRASSPAFSSVASPELLPTPLSVAHCRAPASSTMDIPTLRHIKSMDSVLTQSADGTDSTISNIPVPQIMPRAGTGGLRAPSRCASPLGRIESGLVSPVSTDELISPIMSYFPGRPASPISRSVSPSGGRFAVVIGPSMSSEQLRQRQPSESSQRRQVRASSIGLAR